MFAGEEGAVRVDGTLITFGICPLADHLAVLL
jgi:hypothetical protein